MKITKAKLKEIINEEIQTIINEEDLDEAFFSNVGGRMANYFRRPRLGGSTSETDDKEDVQTTPGIASDDPTEIPTRPPPPVGTKLKTKVSIGNQVMGQIRANKDELNLDSKNMETVKNNLTKHLAGKSIVDDSVKKDVIKKLPLVTKMELYDIIRKNMGQAASHEAVIKIASMLWDSDVVKEDKTLQNRLATLIKECLGDI